VDHFILGPGWLAWLYFPQFWNGGIIPLQGLGPVIPGHRLWAVLFP